MTDYVLEILDGDRAGEIVELGIEPLTFGRRQGNAVVLSDEKVSGQHATITLEDGQWVLKDLGSTNGTLMDGRRVEEVGLTANDIFQLGRVRVAYKEAGAPTPQAAGGGDLAMRTVDQALLAKTRKRGPGMGILLGLVVILGGGAAWMFLGGGGSTGRGGKARPPLEVAGNRLPEGDMEPTDADVAEGEERWNLAQSGTGFEAETSRRASHTGRGYLVARRDADATSRHALARTLHEQVVSAPGGVRVRAWVKTAGGARAAVRLRFSSTNRDLPATVTTGTAPVAATDKYTELTLSAGVPSGCDRVAVELLALLPGADATVSVDDVALLDQADAVSHDIRTPIGQQVTGSGGGLVLLDAESQMVMTGIRPVTADAALQELAKAGLLTLTDAGMQLQATDREGGIDLHITGRSGGVELMFEAGQVAAGLLARKGTEPFREYGATFKLDDVEQLLLGYDSSRVMVVLPAAGRLEGAIVGDRFVLTIPAGGKLRVVYDFAAQREQARVLLGQATEHHDAGDYRRVLDKIDAALASYPHDNRQAAKLAALRTAVRTRLGDRVRYFEAELDKLGFFESLSGYRRIKSELDAMVATYGESHMLQPKKVAAMRQRVDATIQRIEGETSEATKANLERLARVLSASGSQADTELVAVVNKYIADYLPKGSAKKEEGK